MKGWALLQAALEALLRAFLAILFVGFVKRPLMCCTDVDPAMEGQFDLLVVASGILVFAALLTPLFGLLVLALRRVVSDAALRAFLGGAIGLTLMIGGIDWWQSEYWVEGARWMPLSYFTVAACGGAAGFLAYWVLRRGLGRNRS
jgi:hypothetical protein